MRDIFNTVQTAQDYRAQLQEQAQYIEKVIPIPVHDRPGFSETVMDYMFQMEGKDSLLKDAELSVEDAESYVIKDAVLLYTITEFMQTLLRFRNKPLMIPPCKDVWQGFLGDPWAAGYSFLDIEMGTTYLLNREDFRRDRRTVRQDMSTLNVLAAQVLPDLDGQGLLDLMGSRHDYEEMVLLVSAGSLTSFQEARAFNQQNKEQHLSTPVAQHREQVVDLEDVFGSRPDK